MRKEVIGRSKEEKDKKDYKNKRSSKKEKRSELGSVQINMLQRNWKLKRKMKKL